MKVAILLFITTVALWGQKVPTVSVAVATDKSLDLAEVPEKFTLRILDNGSSLFIANYSSSLTITPSVSQVEGKILIDWKPKWPLEAKKPAVPVTNIYPQLESRRYLTPTKEAVEVGFHNLLINGTDYAVSLWNSFAPIRSPYLEVEIKAGKFTNYRLR